MARVHGRSGALYVGLASGSATPQPLVNLSTWSLDAATDKTDVTAMGDTNKTYVSGLPDASGSFGGFYDDAANQHYTAASDGVARKFYLYPDTRTPTRYWFGTAIFDYSASGGVGDAVGVSGNWAAASSIIPVGIA